MAVQPPRHPPTIPFNRVPAVGMNQTSTFLHPSSNGATPPPSCVLDFSTHLPTHSPQTPPPTPILPATVSAQKKRPHHHHLHPPNTVSTGLQLAFSHHPTSALPKELAAQVWRQTAELEQMLLAQGEHLRAAVAERRRRQWRETAAAAEECMGIRLREKEMEIGKALVVNAELQAKVERISMEAKQWRVRAKEHEAAAAGLQARLSSAGEKGGGGDAAAEDAESACVEEGGGEVQRWVPLCKVCGRREAFMVILPCRHLCLCKECTVSVQACPSCSSPMRGSVEVFFS